MDGVQIEVQNRRTLRLEVSMKIKMAAKTLGFAIATTFILALAPGAQAADSSCSVERAAGRYAVSDSGTVLGIGPRAAVALLTLDAAGNIKGTVTASLNGAVSNSRLAGTYTVNGDCTGTTTFGEYDQSGNLLITATVALAWDDDMREFRFLFTSVTLPDGSSLSTVINGDARKVVN
jgi:hypothetical protein